MKTTSKTETKKSITKSNEKTDSTSKSKSSTEAQRTTIILKTERGCKLYQLKAGNESLVQMTLKRIPDPYCFDMMQELQKMAEAGATKEELAEQKKEWYDAWVEGFASEVPLHEHHG